VRGTCPHGTNCLRRHSGQPGRDPNYKRSTKATSDYQQRNADNRSRPPGGSYYAGQVPPAPHYQQALSPARPPAWYDQQRGAPAASMHHGFLHSGAWVILDGSPIDLPVAAAMSPTVTTAAAQLTHDDGLIDLLTTAVVPPFETAAALQLSITGTLVPARPLYGLPSNKLDLPTAASPAFGMPSSAAKALQFGVRFQLTATGKQLVNLVQPLMCVQHSPALRGLHFTALRSLLLGQLQCS
jgi:hypothetical protein